MNAVSLDDIDRNILRSLQKDCSLSQDALAEAVNLSRNACTRRVKRLEDAGLILRRVAILNHQALGRGLIAIVSIRTNQHEKGWLDRFRTAIELMPEVVGAYRMTGDLDYLLRVKLGDIQSYDQFYQRLIERVPSADISTSFVMEAITDTTEIPL